VLLLVSLFLVTATLTAVTWEVTTAQASAHRITTISLKMARAYKPRAPLGATDDYHCTLMNPRVTHNSYVIASQFFPGSAEDRHAILFLVPPSLAATDSREARWSRNQISPIWA